MAPPLPREIIDRILLLVDVRVAISLGNEYVKRELLPYTSRPACYRLDPDCQEWCKHYKVGSKRISSRGVEIVIGRRHSGKSHIIRQMMRSQMRQNFLNYMKVTGMRLALSPHKTEEITNDKNEAQTTMGQQEALPQEIVDRILLLCDVRVAIALKNEYVKRKLLPFYRAKKPTKGSSDSDLALLDAWINEYKVGSGIPEPVSGGGGLLQLLGFGTQDRYLTGSSQTSFLRTVYRRHTNFAMESMETFTGNADFGRKVSCLVARNGDLVNKSFLQVQLPLLSDS